MGERREEERQETGVSKDEEGEEEEEASSCKDAGRSSPVRVSAFAFAVVESETVLEIVALVGILVEESCALPCLGNHGLGNRRGKAEEAAG